MSAKWTVKNCKSLEEKWDLSQVQWGGWYMLVCFLAENCNVVKGTILCMCPVHEVCVLISHDSIVFVLLSQHWSMVRQVRGDQSEARNESPMWC